MKICAFGNSFLIAIREALEDSTFKGNVTFVAGDAKKWSASIADEIKLGSDMLLFFAEGKGPDILLSDYDAFIVVGLRFSLDVVVRVYHRHRLWQHATSRHQILSDKALHLAMKGQLMQTPAADLARRLRQITDKPILLIPNPNPVEAIREVTPTTDQLKFSLVNWQVFFDDKAGLELYNAFLRAANEVASELSVRFLPQPKDTLTAVFTKNMYRVEFKPSYESKTLPRNTDDVFHLNALFGAHVVKQIEPLLTRA